MTITSDQKLAAFRMLHAVAEAIRGLGSVPSGHLYAQLMASMDLPTYTRILELLKGAELVRESAHELTWTGPADGPKVAR